MALPTITPMNGRLPDALLSVADTGANGPQRLRWDVAIIWRAMLAAGMPAGCLTSGYRTLAQQEDEVARAHAGQTPSAADPGHSMHGEGLAADVAEPARSWVRAWGKPYGVLLDTVPDEPWHDVIDPTRATYTGPATPAPVTTTTPDVPQEAPVDRSVRLFYIQTVCALPTNLEVGWWSREILAGRQTFRSLEVALASDARYAASAALGSEAARNEVRDRLIAAL